MRWLCLLLPFASIAALACSKGDGAVTDDGAEVQDGIGVLERQMKPQMTPPTSDLIGASMADLVATETANATQISSHKADDCTTTELEDQPTGKKLEHVVCKYSEVLRITTDKGQIEHADLNKDGKVDRYTDDSSAIAQYVDRNYDGTIDVVVERVSMLKDFSLKGYGVSYPKSNFLFRIREDSNRDGKLDTERLTARGLLPKTAADDEAAASAPSSSDSE